MERASARRAPDQGPSSLHPTTRRPEAPGEAPHPLDGHPPEYPDEATHGPTHPRERPLVGQTPQKHALTERHPRRVWGRTATPLPQPGGRRRRAADDVHPSGTSIESQSARGGAQRSRPRPNAPKRAPPLPHTRATHPPTEPTAGGRSPGAREPPGDPGPGGGPRRGRSSPSTGVPDRALAHRGPVDGRPGHQAPPEQGSLPGLRRIPRSPAHRSEGPARPGKRVEGTPHAPEPREGADAGASRAGGAPTKRP